MTSLEEIKENLARPGYVEYINPTTLRPTRDARPDIDWLVERVERLEKALNRVVYGDDDCEHCCDLATRALKEPAASGEKA